MFNACPRVRFAPEAQVCTFNTALEAITVTCNSGADGNYVSEQDRKKQDSRYYDDQRDEST